MEVSIAVVYFRSCAKFQGTALPETDCKTHLKMDGWKTILSFWGPAYFSGAFAVSLRDRREGR